MLSFVGAFLAGMATLLSAIPQFATEGKITRNWVPASVASIGAPLRIGLNILALLPAVYVVWQYGIASWQTAFVVLGFFFGALPVMIYLTWDPEAVAARQPGL